MSAPVLSRRMPLSSVVAGRDQQLFANVAVMQLFKDNQTLKEFKVKVSGRQAWYDGSAGNQIVCKPITLGISKRNVMTLGASFHRRDPVIAIHIFSRDVDAIDRITDEVDRIIINYGVNPQKGIQNILPASMGTVTADDTDKDSGAVLFHNIVFVECLFYKNRTTS